MDVRYINPFIEGVKHVFFTMLETEIFISKPFVKADTESLADVSAVISLSGDATGSVTLCLPLQSAVRIASKFAGVEMSKDHKDFADALGELANMVAGHAKSKLDGLMCNISIPHVVIGKDHVLPSMRTMTKLVLPCDSTLGRFWVEVGLVVKRPSAGADAGGQTKVGAQVVDQGA